MTGSTYRSHALPLIRPAWTPATIALTVGGFIVFAPAGLAMLAYIIFGERFNTWRANGGSWRDVMQGKMQNNKDAPSSTSSNWFREMKTNRNGFNATGNVAFDDWRDAELNRLAEERVKLDQMRDEFDAYARELRRAKDKEEFDRFMNARSTANTKSATRPDVKDE